MKMGTMTNKAPTKKPKKKPTSKEVIVKLAKFIAKDAPKAKLGPNLEKRIIRELGRVLEQVDTHLPKKDIMEGMCRCHYDGFTRCITISNCDGIPGTCIGPCSGG
jgi:hypothetical protein